MSSLGENLKRVREAAGMSQLELSEKTGISNVYISNIENEIKKNPSAKLLGKIADTLGIEIGELLTTEVELDIAIETMDKINELAKQALSKKDFDFENTIYSIAGKFDSEKFTDDEQKEIINYIRFVLSKRDN